MTVGHALQTQGLPVYWVSLRGLQSKADLTSKFLCLLRQRQPTTNNQPSDQRLSLDDEICQLFSEISKMSVFILDNADDLLESGGPKVKEEVIQLLEEILRQNPRVTFIVTTRRSLEFMDNHFQGHQGLRIRTLDEASAQSLVHEFLPNACVADCTEVAQICGKVPLAIKLICSLMSKDSSSPRHFLDELKASSTESIVSMLDNPDYPTSHRLQFIFDSSFQRLTAQEQEELISLSILPENFTTEVAAAVLGTKSGIQAKRTLQNLRRKSLIDSGSKPRTFTMHKLLQQFSKEKGDTEMNKTILNAKGRLNAFYVSYFDKLNRQFLTGHSMDAYIAIYEDKESINQSLVEGGLDSKTADTVFDILVKG
ncbi:MAG: NACHT domain-containing protein, partial [Phycisphaerales bacterium]|nr:NACHT domain-containing protein [Phycisphaerales bacterium]